jgi:hypothetical protein
LSTYYRRLQLRYHVTIVDLKRMSVVSFRKLTRTM